MTAAEQRRKQLEADITELRQRLGDAEETLSAIVGGSVDALVVHDPVEERQVVMLGKPSQNVLVDRLQQGAVTLSSLGLISHANQRFAEMLGISAAALIGTAFTRLVSKRDHAALTTMLRGDSEASRTEITLQRADGVLLHALIAHVPAADGGFYLIVTSLSDSIRHDDAQATVRAIHRGEVDAVVVADSSDDPQVLLIGPAGRRYRVLVEHMHDGVVTLSSEGDVLYANPRFAAMLGVSAGELVGTRPEDFLDDQHRPLLAALLDGRRGGGSQAELTLRRRDGGHFQALLTPVPNADEHGISLIVTDLTIRQRLEEAEEILRAIGSGEVDAFVVAREHGEEVETLGGAHRPYRMMVEKMQQGAVTLAKNGDILYTNEPFAAMLGRPLATLVGTRLGDVVAAGDQALLSALIDAKHGAATQGELTLRHKDGGLISTLVAVALLPDEGGVCLIVTDLTAQKAYEAMVAAQALERSILEQAVDAIVLCDPESRVIRASRAALDMCGTNPLLRPFADSFSLESRGGVPVLAAALRGAVTLKSEEYTLHRADLPDVTVLLSAGPVIDADGQTRGGVVTMTDITKRRQAEDRLRDSDRHKDEFLAILAHELRNPLAPIRSAVEILKGSDGSKADPHTAYAVEVIERQSTNLIRLVDDLLDINRINQGKIVLQVSVTDMRSVVEQAIEASRPLLTARRHTFEPRLPREPVPVKGDTVRLAQVIINLLGNAANYTPPGGRIALAVTVERSTERPHGQTQAVVSVTDNGIGIPAEMLARIFEPYQQASQTKERTTGGLGLGLTVCRRLMEMHGGSVEAYSEGAGCGSRFVVRLALAEAAPAEVSDSKAAAPRPAGLRVLVVDDNHDAGETLARLMEIFGHEVTMLEDGAAALAQAAQIRPDVVLLDIGMPGMSGYEVAQRLRELPGANRMCLIAMTGYGSADDRQKSRDSGIDHHLVKPVDFTALQELLASLTAR